MPYRDLLQDQIERFSKALQELLASLVRKEASAGDQLKQLQSILQEEMDTDFNQLLNAESEALEAWLAQKHISTQHTEHWIACQIEIARQLQTEDAERSRSIALFTLRLLNALQHKQNTISIKQLEWQEQLMRLTA